MKRIHVLVLGVLAFAAPLLAAERANSVFEKGLAKERAEGDYRGAIKFYERVVKEHAGDRKLAAQALVRIGECHDKLGDAEARKAFERVVREFADQKESVDVARARLAVIGKTASGPTTRIIGKDSWLDGWVSPSADGRFLLRYAINGDVDLRDMQSGRVQRIATDVWYGATVSPDGRQVAFLRGREGVRELYIVGVDGFGERLLWKAEKDWRAHSPQWLPDSKRVVLTVSAQDRSRLMTVSASDGVATILWEGKQFVYPQLSPDGRSVVFLKRARQDPAGDQLWLLRIEDRSETLVFDGQSYMACPLWMPDGTGVVFLSDRRAPGMNVDLWLLRIAGGKPSGFPELLKTGLGAMAAGHTTAWPTGPITRDGTYYYHLARGGIKQLLRVMYDPDSGKVAGASSFVARKGGASGSPSFSGDGRWLVYQAQSERSTPVWMLQAVESGEERVLSMAGSISELEWACAFPDGRSALVLAVHSKDGRGLYRVDMANGTSSPLPRPAGEVMGVPSGFSPDGRTIILNRMGARNHVVAWDIETGQERELAVGRGLLASLSQDGNQLAISRPDGKELVIELMPATGGPRREVYRGAGYQGAEITWTPDGRYIIFGPFDRINMLNSSKIMRVLVEGGEPQPIGLSASADGLVRFPQGFRALRVHPSGRQLIYVAVSDGGSAGENWALENFLPKTTK
ncbi:MAG: PD40 domain-containing protein [Acidobacteria bacterium]|nr:PD40 domain-containing protein [Acidobacteriota bacterium]